MIMMIKMFKRFVHSNDTPIKTNICNDIYRAYDSNGG